MAVVHKDIRILFEVGGHRYEAAGFLNEDGREVINDEGGAFLLKHLGELPQSLRPYVLITNRPAQAPRGTALYLRFVKDEWGQGWHQFVIRPHGCRCLVVRRLS